MVIDPPNFRIRYMSGSRAAFHVDMSSPHINTSRGAVQGDTSRKLFVQTCTFTTKLQGSVYRQPILSSVKAQVHHYHLTVQCVMVLRLLNLLSLACSHLWPSLLKCALSAVYGAPQSLTRLLAAPT